MISIRNRLNILILIFTNLVILGCSLNNNSINKIELSNMYFKGEIVNYEKSEHSISYPKSYSPPTRYIFKVNNDASFVSIKVFDINSNLISVVFEESLDSGSYEIKRIESNLNSGAYIMVFNINDVSLKKLFIVK